MGLGAGALAGKRIGRQLEGLDAMRLEVERLRVPLHRTFADAGDAGHRSRAPVRATVVGLVCNAVAISCATRSSSTVRGRPGRNSSYSPVMRYRAYRSRQVATVLRLIVVSCASVRSRMHVPCRVG